VAGRRRRGASPAGPESEGPLFDVAEREEIAVARAGGESMRSIARRLGRSPSTVSRELSRNADRAAGYLQPPAQTLSPRIGRPRGPPFHCTALPWRGGYPKQRPGGFARRDPEASSGRATLLGSRPRQAFGEAAVHGYLTAVSKPTHDGQTTPRSGSLASAQLPKTPRGEAGGNSSDGTWFAGREPLASINGPAGQPPAGIRGRIIRPHHRRGRAQRQHADKRSGLAAAPAA
jgi:DNA-binding CsgD family transcriptional regulator